MFLCFTERCDCLVHTGIIRGPGGDLTQEEKHIVFCQNREGAKRQAEKNEKGAGGFQMSQMFIIREEEGIR